MRTLGRFLAEALALSACTPDDHQDTATGPDLVIRPLCKAGCVDPDPYPNAPGVFLGSATTPETCVGGGQTDHDGDGLSTFCENNLAMAFAPELRFWQFDEIGREPYWAARPTSPGDGSVVTIAYLIGYYRDAGSNTHPGRSSRYRHCGLRMTGPTGVAGGHRCRHYNWDTEHWVLDQARFSQHDSYGTYLRGSSEYPTQLQYPSHDGAYPRAYVSQGKHANYRSESECNAGGAFNTDTCEEVDTSERLFVSGAYNIGSSGTHLLDCVVSRDPSYIYYGSGRQECFWTYSAFRGWIPTYIGGPASTAYSARLDFEGFLQ